MNPDEVFIKQIKNVLEQDLNKLHEIVNHETIDRKTLEEAYFLSHEIQMYLYRLYSLTT